MKFYNDYHLSGLLVLTAKRLESFSFASSFNTFLFKVHMAMPMPGC
ncbi:MAG: hypothetical protein ACOCYO_05685 [Bacteroidota bacterium]